MGVLTMRVSLAVAVFFFFGLTVAQDYAYLTYWSDNRCTNFVGSRVMTENDQFISAANAGSGGCRQELYCLVDASSPDCTAISVTGGGNIRIRTNGNVVTEFFNNDAGTKLILDLVLKVLSMLIVGSTTTQTVKLKTFSKMILIVTLQETLPTLPEVQDLQAHPLMLQQSSCQSSSSLQLLV